MNDSRDLKKDVSYINKLNKTEVLRLIRLSGVVSRAEIVKTCFLG